MKNMLKSIMMSLVVGKNYKQLALLTTCLLLSSALYAQEFEVYGGANSFKMFTERNARIEPKHSRSIKPMIGISVGEIFRYEIFSLRVEAEFYKVNRTYNTSSGGIGAGSNQEGRIKNSNLAIRAYPFNIRIIEELELNFGLAWTPTLSYSDTGTTYSYDPISGGRNASYNISKDPFEVINMGIVTRCAIRLMLGKDWLLTPQYRFHIISPGAAMHTIGLGLTYIKTKK